MPISPITFPTMPVPGVQEAAPAPAVTSTDPANDGFAEVLAASADNLQIQQTKADTLGLQAATGDLTDVHDYIIASTEAGLATQTVVTLRNKAVEAFNEIMRMPV